ncbi:unnamed protein product [Calypogeia fissa]
MDRRGHRTVIDPKVRQVGFVTPGAPDSTTKGGGGNEKDAIPSTPDGLDASSSSPVMIPPPGIMVAPATPHAASSGRQILHVEGSVPADSVDGSLPPNTPSTPTGKNLNNAAVADQKDGQQQQKGLKERTSKAERRAAQEAQRAAKAAAKNAAGVGGVQQTQAAPKAAGKGPAVAPAASKGGEAEGSSSHQIPRPPAGGKESSLQRKSSSSSDQKSVAESVKSLEKKKKKDMPAPRMQFDDEQQVEKAKKRALVEQTETKNRVELFRHLPQFVHGTMLPSLEVKFFMEDVLHLHPAIYKAGLQLLTGDVVGGNARCVLMLLAFREMIGDYTTPPEKIFVRDLTVKINSHVSFLANCRPLAVSMGNAIKFLKSRIVNLSGTISDAEAKSTLISEINRFIQEQIVYADKEIVKHAVQKIRDGDVCLTYGSSSVVEMIFVQAHELGKKFSVVVVDSRPKLEGERLLKRLLRQGIDCTYTYLNGVSYIMQEVTRVFLGAASVLSNGTVYSRVGTASVAMMAHAYSVPVMFCCETYKFHERVQLDSITANELGDPNVLATVRGRAQLKEISEWEDDKHLQLLNLIYDATPSDYVSMIVTELGMVPPTSVPVILREYRRELPM